MTATETYPRNWDWDTDGDVLRGRFVEIGEAPTANGERPILTLELEGGEHVTVWLFHEALRNKVAEEVARRPSGDLTAGEPVVIERLEWRESGAGRRYRPYRANFPERPRRSAAEILGTPKPERDADDVEDDVAGAESDIPF